eukprot:CAMPEP_0113923448 /NCGR_PEP_ID=MMETSP1159-20121227/2151_1 /TAXON_ID=88271 /ORGANISM="Picocystis salinarum" /LENGTH=106 /DNA_ID=CAMNT_0000923623 /DNA_START=108 /DNA_END=424 /DNA_ORIENTATION=- /assembly_acc=CAM_ASM_000767
MPGSLPLGLDQLIGIEYEASEGTVAQVRLSHDHGHTPQVTFTDPAFWFREIRAHLLPRFWWIVAGNGLDEDILFADVHHGIGKSTPVHKPAERVQDLEDCLFTAQR